MKKTLLFFFLLPMAFAQLELSEIMSNPLEGSEWLEFYYTGPLLNITGLKIQDNYNTDDILCCEPNCSMFLENNTFFLILEADNQMNKIGKAFCVDDKSIGNSLGNSEDNILLFKENKTYVNITYSIDTEKGNTLSFFETGYAESIPTPWHPNRLYEPIQFELFPIATLAMMGTSLKLFKIVNNNRSDTLVSFYSNLTLHVGNTSFLIYESITSPKMKYSTTQPTGEYFFNTSGNYTSCGRLPEYNISLCYLVTVVDTTSIPCNISLSLFLEKQIYDYGEKINLYNILSNDTYPYEISYWAEDIFGKITKKEVITKNQNKKSYTPKFEGSEKAFFINSKLLFIACNNTNNHTEEEKLIVVKGQDTKENIMPSEIEIIEIYPSTGIVFGDTVKAKLRIYKGDTAKNSISLYVKGDHQVTKTQSIYLYGKDKEIVFTISLQLEQNCDRKHKEGTYSLILEGLGNSVKKKINIKGRSSACQEDEKQDAQHTIQKKKTISRIIVPQKEYYLWRHLGYSNFIIKPR